MAETLGCGEADAKLLFGTVATENAEPNQRALRPWEGRIYTNFEA